MHIDPALPVIVGAILSILLIGLAIFGAILQVAATVAAVWVVGIYLDWTFAQIVLFSFVLAALAHTGQILPDDDYRMIVAIIAISLMLSPAWIGLCKVMLDHPEGKPDHSRLT